MYHTTKDTFTYQCPTRSRNDIERSRNIANDKVNNQRYERIRSFCEATGARRIGLTRLTLNDLRERKDGGLEIHLKEKNGMDRWARVLPEKEEYIKSVFNNSNGIEVNHELRLFEKKDIPRNCELHSCRSTYAIKMYDLYEKEGYRNNQIYSCRKDKEGLSYDKGVLKKVSKALGHHRCDVVVSHYLYK